MRTAFTRNLVRTTSKRQAGLDVRPARRGRVGFTFNEKRVYPTPSGEQDAEAEFDPPEVLEAIRSALTRQGWEVIDLEATDDLPVRLASTPVDLVFNIAEGRTGRHRESHVPALLEMVEIPYTGSDPAALALSLDKALAKRIVAGYGVPTPRFVVAEGADESLPDDLPRFPLIVKPVAEGTSKGITARSVVHDERGLRSAVRTVIERYRQPALVEEYLPGREFTVALLGYPTPRVLPPLEILFRDHSDPAPVYSFELKLAPSAKLGYQVPAALAPAALAALTEAARVSFAALGCRDVARLDFRMDGGGRPHFLECNPLPGLAPGWSDLVLIAQAAGIEYDALIGEILSCALQRCTLATRND